MFEQGKGARVSESAALRLYDAAAAQGYAPAVEALERMGV